MSGAVATANKRTTGKLFLVALVMFGFGYLLVPLYDVFCEIAGVGRIEQSGPVETTMVDSQRWITIEFTGTVMNGLPWEFTPLQRKIKVHPGQPTTVAFLAKNRASNAIVGQAVPSITPGIAKKFFNKTECFCFSQQVLAGNEVKEMPLLFVVDRQLPETVNTITLSYSFFNVDDKVVAEISTQAQAL